jgi:intermembrane space import and assembly protein 40
LEGGINAQELQEEAGQEAAFNPETGEINWDCPCLGGMAHGPCGEDFKAAFSCFVYSEEEPKGIDCIEKFKYVALSVLGDYRVLITSQGNARLFPPIP